MRLSPIPTSSPWIGPPSTGHGSRAPAGERPSTPGPSAPRRAAQASRGSGRRAHLGGLWPTANLVSSPSIALGVSAHRCGRVDRLAGDDPFAEPRLSRRARGFGQRRAGHRLDSGADPARGRRARICSPPRRPISRPTAKANMCSTMAGPRPGSAWVASIIQAAGCGPIHPVPGPRLLGSRPQYLLAAIERSPCSRPVLGAHHLR